MSSAAAATQPSTVLYHATLHPGAAASGCVGGSFTAAGALEAVVARTGAIELVRVDGGTGRSTPVARQDVFGVVRAVAAVRLSGDEVDSLVVSSDSGRLVVLRFEPARQAFAPLCSEPYGRSGCRRAVAGQYLACDPHGRAVMVAAVQKQRIVYVLNRDAAGALAVSSPIEANLDEGAVLLGCAALDCGLGNPQFACLELARDGAKQLAVYELDLGSNHITRASSRPADPGAAGVVALPGEGAGALVLGDGFVARGDGGERVELPRRLGAGGPSLVAAHAAAAGADGDVVLLQTEEGDLLRLDGGGKGVSYLGSVPACAAMCVLPPGFLLLAAEFGDHLVLRVTGLAALPGQGAAFEPQPPPGMVPADRMASAAPLVDALVADLAGEGTPQVYALCGRGHRSSLRVLRQGLAVSELAAVGMPQAPTRVWSVGRRLVISFEASSMVLGVGDDGAVSELLDTGLDEEKATVYAGTLAGGTLLQVTEGGFRLVGPSGPPQEWRAPGLKKVKHAAGNDRQLALALTGGELRCFMLNEHDRLVEAGQADLRQDVAALAISPLSPGRLQAAFIAVAAVADKNVRVLYVGLGRDSNSFVQMAIQSLSVIPSSLLLASLGGSLRLFAGLTNGTLVRLTVDGETGALSDPRRRVLGPRRVQLRAVTAAGEPAVLALGARPWLVHHHGGRAVTQPLSFHELDDAATFPQADVPDAFVAVGGGVLRVALVERYGDAFNQTVFPLDYTPRRLAAHPVTRHVVLIESDDRSATRDERVKQREAVRERAKAAGLAEPAADAAAWSADFCGPPAAGEAGEWAGLVRLLDPVSGESVCVVDLPANEAAFSLEVVQFASRPDEHFAAVGTVTGYRAAGPGPPAFDSCAIRIYRFATTNTVMELVHVTQVDEPPLALRSFGGLLMAGVGPLVRLYDYGRSRLLRKAECGPFAGAVRTLEATGGGRALVGDVREGVSVVRWAPAERRLDVVSSGRAPCHLTAACVLDRGTAAVADRFGTVSLWREGPAGGGGGGGGVGDMGAVAGIYTGDVVTALRRAQLTPQGDDVLLYFTISGGVGMLQPFRSREEADFVTVLEMHMRQQHPPLLGRDHMAFRSYYSPVRSVLDGDLCERYAELPLGTRASIAAELQSSPDDVLRRLEDMRARVM